MSIYDYKINTNTGTELKFQDFGGKVILIVNVASGCGFTPQYEGLENLYKKYKDKGLVIIGFPCNQFLSQEPGTDEEIHTFCTSKYNVTFPVATKINVNGTNADPIYKFLKDAAPFKGFANEDEEKLLTPILDKIAPEFLEGNEIKWNFTKFLVCKNGDKVERFQPSITPENLEDAIIAYLK